MLRSMYSGVAGLKAHQVKMDVIGNNIANVNTTGFKGSRVTFKEMLNQTIQGARAPQGNIGGMNPIQVGLGVGVGSIDVDHTQGNLKSTGVATDLALQGNGFFVLNNGQQDVYTRAGSLSLDSNGNLVSSVNGFRVQGWMADQNGLINTDNPIAGVNIPIGQGMPAEATQQVIFGGNLDSRSENGVARTAAIDVFDSLGNKHTINLDFLRRIGTNYTASNNDFPATSGNTMTINQETFDPRMDGFQIAFLADNNTDMDVQISGNTISVAADWDGSNTTAPSLTDVREAINTVLKENDYTGTISIDYDGTPADLAGAGTMTLGLPTVNSGAQTINLYQDPDYPDAGFDGMEVRFVDNNSTPSARYEDGILVVNADWDGNNSATPPNTDDVLDVVNNELSEKGFEGKLAWNLGSYAAADLADLDSKNVTMSASSHWDWDVADISDSIDSSVSGGGTLMFDANGRVFSGGDASITFDPIEGAAPSQTIQLSFNDPQGSISQRASSYTIDGLYADGFESGDLESFSINSTGMITGNYSNGVNQYLGQIAIASFSNPNGLTKEADTLFAESKNSGIAQVGQAGNGGRGEISGGSLEMSNVDLAQQFTEMITAQRGFQANSKIITTSDQMLQDLVNLKR